MEVNSIGLFLCVCLNSLSVMKVSEVTYTGGDNCHEGSRALEALRGWGWVVLAPTASISISLWVCLGPKESCKASGLKVPSRLLYLYPHMGSPAGFPLGIAGQSHGHRCLREGDSQSTSC